MVPTTGEQLIDQVIQKALECQQDRARSKTLDTSFATLKISENGSCNKGSGRKMFRDKHFKLFVDSQIFRKPQTNQSSQRCSTFSTNYDSDSQAFSFNSNHTAVCDKIQILTPGSLNNNLFRSTADVKLASERTAILDLELQRYDKYTCRKIEHALKSPNIQIIKLDLPLSPLTNREQIGKKGALQLKLIGTEVSQKQVLDKLKTFGLKVEKPQQKFPRQRQISAVREIQQKNSILIRQMSRDNAQHYKWNNQSNKSEGSYFQIHGRNLNNGKKLNL